MATAKGRRSNRLVWFGAAIVVLLALWLAFGAAALGYARAGSAYGARVACSCRFVAGRPLSDCARDKVSGMELVTLSEDEEDKSVTARMLIVSDTARLKPGYGCVLDRWND
ncbi:hypothetical protein N0B51_02115 [Tsuneonella sp. YG55]|uniref:Uncharacterized protein n=1 Tax=Tsuneonella litorea TaxID=2976475 RepID=A0A9X2W0Q2_9SPHN|nr:hypothetical protein [Tsuneonella litorea]MCT2557770.1 hypothetical protein [Tsuneonella litorea]